MPGRKWTTEQRARQAEVCRKHKPWRKSTGPKTIQGQIRASKNGFKSFFSTAAPKAFGKQSARESPMSALIQNLTDIEHQLLQVRCGLLTEGDKADPTTVVGSVLDLSARLQQAAENFVADLERQRG